MSIEAVVFDLDNTLYDENHYLQAALQVFSEQQKLDFSNFSSINFSELRLNNKDILQELLHIADAYSPQNHDKLFACYSTLSVGISLYPGVEDALEKIKKMEIKVGLLTNGVIEVQKNKLANLGVQNYFDDIQFARINGLDFEKPHQSAFYRSCEGLNTDPAVTVMVGDNWVNDIEGAKAAGMKTYYVGSAFFDRTLDIRKLPAWLCSNEC